MYKKIIISAFNIHTGGGFTLLNEILNHNKAAKYFDKLILDERTRKRFHTLKLKKVFAKKKFSAGYLNFYFIQVSLIKIKFYFVLMDFLLSLILNVKLLFIFKHFISQRDQNLIRSHLLYL